MKKIGDVVTFNTRRGYVVGYWTGKRHGYAEEVNTYYVVELDSDSSAYLEASNDDPKSHHDAFITMTLVNHENVD